MTPAELRRIAEWLEGCVAPLAFVTQRDDAAKVAEAIHLARKLREEADAWESCESCHGEGEVFGHAEDCRDDLCALNGDMHSCVGRVLPCNCRPLPPGPEA